MTPPLAMHFAITLLALSALFVALGEQRLSVAPEVEAAAIRIVQGMPK